VTLKLAETSVLKSRPSVPYGANSYTTSLGATTLLVECPLQWKSVDNYFFILSIRINSALFTAVYKL